MKGFDNNKEAMQVESNFIGSLSNRIRQVYNLGYKEGLKDGAHQVTQALVEKMLEEQEKENSNDE